MMCDTYLSVSTPVQIAARALLDRGTSVRDQIQHRVRANYRRAIELTAGTSVRALPEGGWYGVLSVPAIGPEEDLVVDLLEKSDVLAHPGYFFDFPRGSFLVVSCGPVNFRVRYRAYPPALRLQPVTPVDPPPQPPERPVRSSYSVVFIITSRRLWGNRRDRRHRRGDELAGRGGAEPATAPAAECHGARPAFAVLGDERACPGSDLHHDGGGAGVSSDRRRVKSRHRVPRRAGVGSQVLACGLHRCQAVEAHGSQIVLRPVLRALNGSATPTRGGVSDGLSTPRPRRWLDDYALFQALHVREGRPWTEWPAPLCDREPGAIAAARRELDEEILFYEYLQWIADTEWQEARRAARANGVALSGDLPFMVDANSADVWSASGQASRLDDLDWRAARCVPVRRSRAGLGHAIYRWDASRRRRLCLASGSAPPEAPRSSTHFGVDHLVGFYRTCHAGRSTAARRFFRRPRREQQVEARRARAQHRSSTAAPPSSPRGSRH